MSILSTIGGFIGKAMFASNPILGAALGSGIGSLLSGGDTGDALKAAALGGIGGGALGNTAIGNAVSNVLGFGGAQPEETGTAPSGIMGLFNTDDPTKNFSNLLTVGGLGLAGLGALKGPPDPLAEYQKLQDYLSERWDSIEVPEAGYYTDPVSYRYFDTQEELRAFQERQREKGVPGYAVGGLIEGPGTGTSDDIPAMIYQDGQPVREAALSNGEVVLSLKDLKNIGNGDADMAGRVIGDAPNGTRGAVAAKLYRSMRA